MRSTISVSIAFSIAGLALAGCATSNPELVRAGLPLGAIEVRNMAEHPITDLRIGICGETFMGGPDYGYDRLDRQRIQPGASMSFPASAGCYTISAMTSAGPVFGRTEEYFDTVYVAAEPGSVAVWTVPNR
ncbi:MAG: hypothetical protein JJU26_02795 [Oceanicaulis sp.]|uniref:hypothetical protein n=1 Tax=Glycocaulis sp. TaxID=1969725 RepID=UPI0025C57680|nr:hypothetical protein [Glycocaulis sp.]MCC5980627.1 hypothetical protein [Oceanicaulis sp.]MCH8520464.1 hypothetical protein [Glycocaulis sp.]